MDITIGTPPQKLTLAVDTGSSDFWVNSVGVTYCSVDANKAECTEFGTYNPDRSTTRKPSEDFFQVSYADGVGASGNFAKDTIRIAGVEVPEFQFGVADSSGDPLGVVGLGYEANERQAVPYPTLPERLVSQHLIKLNAFSIWLNDLSGASGTILYGGVDKAKYNGKLATFKIEKGDSTQAPQLGVSLDSISFREATALSPIKPLVDTGSEFTYLPRVMTDIIMKPLGAVYDNLGHWFVECDLASSKETVNFALGTEGHLLTIKVPLSNLVYPSVNIAAPANDKGVTLCNIAISTLLNGDTAAILGDAFLRSAYVVIDLAHDQISIGQALYTSKTNIVEIPPGGIAAINK